MNSLVDSNRAALTALCRRHSVRRLDLFGSAAEGTFDPTKSDLDFLVEFETLSPSNYADAWFGLREELERLFGRPIDLVTRASLVNPFFAARVTATREPLYAA
jgi:predicted nucleotidyltransferase